MRSGEVLAAEWKVMICGRAMAGEENGRSRMVR